MKVRRALIRKRNDVVMETIDLDHEQPRPGEALLRTRATFISAGTELANYTGLDPTVDQPGAWNAYPWPPGYSNVSEVAAIGEGVTAVKPGDRVFTFGRHCSHHFLGGFDRNFFVIVPTGLSDEAAAAARMAEVAITALQVADLQLNDWVAVFGLGSVGNLCAQFFHLSGARVIGVDPFEPRRILARKVGLEHTVGGSEAEVAQAIRDLTGGEGARITVDAVGDSRVIRQAAASTATFGEVIVLGSPRASIPGDLTEITRPVHWRWVTYKGALEWRIPLLPAKGVRHSTLGNVRTIHDLILRGRLKVADLISHRMDPEDIRTAYEGLLNQKDTYWGIVLDWSRTRGSGS